MDSEGIWNACTMKVITKIAITTVPTKDCMEPITSAPKVVTMRRCVGTETFGEAIARPGAAIGASDTTGGRSGEAMGWFDKSMKSTCRTLLVELTYPDGRLAPPRWLPPLLSAKPGMS